MRQTFALRHCFALIVLLDRAGSSLLKCSCSQIQPFTATGLAQSIWYKQRWLLLYHGHRSPASISRFRRSAGDVTCTTSGTVASVRLRVKYLSNLVQRLACHNAFSFCTSNDPTILVGEEKWYQFQSLLLAAIMNGNLVVHDASPFRRR